MKEEEYRKLFALIEGLQYGEIVIKKEAGRIVVVKKTESIKLSE